MTIRTLCANVRLEIVKYIRWKIAKYHSDRKPNICWGEIAAWALYPYPDIHPWNELYESNWQQKCRETGWCGKCINTGRLEY